MSPETRPFVRLRVWLEDRGLTTQRVHAVHPDQGADCPRCSWLYRSPSLCRMVMGVRAGRLILRGAGARVSPERGKLGL